MERNTQQRMYTAGKHLGDLSAEALVLLRALEEAHKLHDLHLGLIAARHVCERDLRL